MKTTEQDMAHAQKLINQFCEYAQVAHDDIKAKNRKAEIVIWRHLLVYYLYTRTCLRLQDIADLCGLSNHTTVVSTKDKIQSKIFGQHTDVLKHHSKLNRILTELP
jgi:chromosomal replication initiation ATPase DnaA